MQNIICGETAYGAGKLFASKIITSEPIDLDDGEEALESPFQYMTRNNDFDKSDLLNKSEKYAKNNDYKGFLSELLMVFDDFKRRRINRWLRVLNIVSFAYPDKISEFRDISMLIWLIEISHCQYFKNWKSISEWTNAILNHFKKIATNKLENDFTIIPAEKLNKGDNVIHRIYGRGVATKRICKVDSSRRITSTITVDFEQHGEKVFPLPDSLNNFSILIREDSRAAGEASISIEANISDFPEWLDAQRIIYEYKDYLGMVLYETISGLLFAKIGLKSKFVENRFKEKGWH